MFLIALSILLSSYMNLCSYLFGTTLLNCTLRESFINVRVLKFVLMYGSCIPRKGIWFRFDTEFHIQGTRSQVKGPRSRVSRKGPGPRSHLWVLGPRSQVKGSDSHVWVPGPESQVPLFWYAGNIWLSYRIKRNKNTSKTTDS